MKYEAAHKEGNYEEALKFKKSTTRIDQQMKDDLWKMLELFGVPVVQAPSEAEAPRTGCTRRRGTWRGRS